MEDYIDRMQVIGVNTFLNKLLTATILLLLVAKVSLLTENSCEKKFIFQSLQYRDFSAGNPGD